MFVDGRNLNGAKISSDICIIGAGAAGISMALEFIGHGLSIIVLESGDFEIDEQTQSLAQGENVSFIDFPLESTRLRFLGGTTNHWGGFTYKLSDIDFKPRPYIPVSGWPISLQEIAAYYPRAAVNCQLGGTGFRDADDWQRQAGNVPLRLDHGPIVPVVGLYSPPTRFGKVYRERLRQAADVKVVLNSNVQELISDSSASQVEVAKVKCIGGSRYEVAARLFVIAAGGLETARLLLLSRQQQDVGLGNGHDLVGRYYMDHPGFSGGELEISPSAPSFGFFMDIYSVDDSRLCGIFTPRPEVLLKANLGNFTIKLFPRDIVPGVDSLTRMRAGILDRQVLGDIGYHLGNILVDIDQIANLAYKNILQSNTGFIAGREHSRTRRTGATMAVHAEQVPNPESRVLLSDETDLFGQRRLKLNWRLQDADRRTLVQSIGLFATAISAAGYGRVRLPSEFDKGDFDPLVEIACHHMGTTRMSDSPKTGVVDANCRVHGINNLYIASSSNFPTSSLLSPTLTIVALALRLADHLKTLHG